MKDAQGHGSNPRAGTQLAFAMRGQMAAHQSGISAMPGQMAAHQSGISRIGGVLGDFARNTSGQGTGIPHSGKLVSLPEAYNVTNASAHTWTHHLSDFGQHVIQNAHHFFGCMAAMMIATELVKFAFGV